MYTTPLLPGTWRRCSLHGHQSSKYCFRKQGGDNSSSLGRKNGLHGRSGSKDSPVFARQDEQCPWIHLISVDTIDLEENALARCSCTCHLAALYSPPCYLQAAVPHRCRPSSCLGRTRYGPRLHPCGTSLEHCSKGHKPSRNQHRGNV